MLSAMWRAWRIVVKSSIDERWARNLAPAMDRQRPQGAQADVVVQADLAIAHGGQQRGRAGAPQHPIGKIVGAAGRRLGDHRDRVAAAPEGARQGVGRGFDAAEAGQEGA